jgi:hypothetical protein
MTNFFSRTRSDWFLGFWAMAPAIALPALVIYWLNTAIYELSDGWWLLAFLGYGALFLTAMIVLIADVWGRSMPVAQQVVWTVATLFLAPLGGVVYWAVCCRR